MAVNKLSLSCGFDFTRHFQDGLLPGLYPGLMVFFAMIPVFCIVN